MGDPDTLFNFKNHNSDETETTNKTHNIPSRQHTNRYMEQEREMCHDLIPLEYDR